MEQSLKKVKVDESIRYLLGSGCDQRNNLFDVARLKRQSICTVQRRDSLKRGILIFPQESKLSLWKEAR